MPHSDNVAEPQPKSLRKPTVYLPYGYEETVENYRCPGCGAKVSCVSIFDGLCYICEVTAYKKKFREDS
jgi:hypothetical protein